MLVTRLQNENVEWVLVDINFAMKHFGSGDIIISKRGSGKVKKSAVYLASYLALSKHLPTSFML